MRGAFSGVRGTISPSISIPCLETAGAMACEPSDAEVGRAILIPVEAGGLVGAMFADLPETFGTRGIGELGDLS